MEARRLIVIEPWICHYEVFPTIIYSAQHYFSSILVETLDISEAKKCLAKYMRRNKISWSRMDVENKMIKTSENNIIWLNTTHMHGNEESYHAMQIKVLMLIQREQQCKQLNIVIHNHHDMKWYQELWKKWIEKQKIN